MIVTVDEVKTHLRIQHDEEDGYLESLIRQAQATAEDYCRVQFSKPITTKTGITQIASCTPPCASRLKTCSILTAIP